MQNRVYMVFACLILGQDLLYAVYEVPCISICRAEQRVKALEKLRMPPTAYEDVSRGGQLRISKKGGGAAGNAGGIPTRTGTGRGSRNAAGRESRESGGGNGTTIGMMTGSGSPRGRGASGVPGGGYRHGSRTSLLQVDLQVCADIVLHWYRT